MTFQLEKQINKETILLIMFEYESIRAKFDKELFNFIKTVHHNSSDPKDVEVFHNYFNMVWPLKSFRDIIIPQTFLRYEIE